MKFKFESTPPPEDEPEQDLDEHSIDESLGEATLMDDELIEDDVSALSESDVNIEEGNSEVIQEMDDACTALEEGVDEFSRSLEEISTQATESLEQNANPEELAEAIEGIEGDIASQAEEIQENVLRAVELEKLIEEKVENGIINNGLYNTLKEKIQNLQSKIDTAWHDNQKLVEGLNVLAFPLVTFLAISQLSSFGPSAPSSPIARIAWMLSPLIAPVISIALTQIEKVRNRRVEEEIKSTEEDIDKWKTEFTEDLKADQYGDHSSEGLAQHLSPEGLDKAIVDTESDISKQAEEIKDTALQSQELDKLIEKKVEEGLMSDEVYRALKEKKTEEKIHYMQEYKKKDDFLFDMFVLYEAGYFDFKL